MLSYQIDTLAFFILSRKSAIKEIRQKIFIINGNFITNDSLRVIVKIDLLLLFHFSVYKRESQKKIVLNLPSSFMMPTHAIPSYIVISYAKVRINWINKNIWDKNKH